MSWNRCDEPGWEPVVIPDGRRGLWMRDNRVDPNDLIMELELCGGREGEDDYLKLKAGQVLSARDLFELWGLMATVQWSVELQACEDHCNDCPRTEYLSRLGYLGRAREELNRWRYRARDFWQRVQDRARDILETMDLD
jgi:hypothetical protein